ncbi:MAG: hypothetical protein SFY81_14025 [Verrucomicrobiota bacterium]|nr:hypothetical protein [Verrucomicrobiota bacterium]
MKTSSTRWIKASLRRACAAACLCSAALAAGEEKQTVKAEPEAPKLETKKETDYRNWLEVSIGGNFIKGNEAQFMERHQIPKDVYGGVTDFHYEQDVGPKGLLEVDGRGIFDNDDYSLTLGYKHPDYGYLRAGYREFRTWYDGTGGYLPINDRVFDLYDDELFVDRSELFFEGGLTLPDAPIIRFGYSRQTRDGQKDSTIWGDTGLGLPAGQTRGIVPSFYNLDEDRDILRLDGEHTIADTRFGVGLRYEHSDQDNSRNMRRRPGEAQDRFLTQREIVETDLFNVRAFQETRFSEKILFTTGYSLTKLDTDIGGSRIYGADYDALYDPLFARRQQRDEGFFDLSGGSKIDQHVLNLNLMLEPWENLTIVPSIRAEKQEQDGISDFEETNVGGPPALPAIIEAIENTRERSFVDVSEGLEARYTGLTNWVLYVRGEWLQGDGDLREREMVLEDGVPPVVSISRDSDSTRFTQKYVAGANWYPKAGLNLAAQYYHKERRNDYDHTNDGTLNTGGDRYPAYIRDQDFTTDDINFRISLRPIQSLSLVTRYDFQISTINSRMDRLSEVESAEMTSHIIGESITWTPLPRLLLQAAVNYVLDRTQTPFSTSAGQANAVQKSIQDYIDASATAGYALTEKTDLLAQYFTYYADNFSDNSAVSVPFLVSAEEHGITGTLIHRFSSAMQWTLKYGWVTLSDKTFGGRNDYEAHILSSAFRFRF